MDSVFSRFCTLKERKLGRQGSFSKPPEYDPDKEEILDSEVDQARKRAYVITYRRATLGGGRHRYLLIRTDAKWLIDSLKRETNGEWQNAIL